MTAHELMLSDLERSGLQRDAKKLQLTALKQAEVKDLTGQAFPAYKIPYLGPDGRPTNFYRLRYLATEVFGQEHQPDQRYWQPPNSGVHLYLPPIKGGWARIFDDVNIPLIITEGEKKAAAATLRHNLVVVGTGGVWSFGAKLKDDKKKRQPVRLLAPEFKSFKLKGRLVEICYDSDLMQRPDLMQALYSLAWELTCLGAMVRYINLPAPGDQKVGLDDYLLNHTTEEFIALPREEAEASVLWKLRERFAVTNRISGGWVFDKLGNAFIREHNFKILTAPIKLLMPNPSTGKLVVTPASTAYLEWPHRHEVAQIEYKPQPYGQPSQSEPDSWNLWSGWPIAPVKGDISPWTRLLDHIFNLTGHPDAAEARTFFVKRLACQLQHPAVKQHTAILLHGPQGSGKTLLGNTLMRLYGDNGVQVGPDQLHEKHNVYLQNKGLIVIEELKDHETGKIDYDLLKAMITQEENYINPKFQPQYSVKAYGNFVFFTNNPDSLKLDDDDRRFFYWSMPLGHKLDERWAHEVYEAWYKSEAGAAALFYHLLYEVDVTKFNPAAPALWTSAKNELIEINRTALEQTIKDLVDNWEQRCDFTTPQDLLVMAGFDLTHTSTRWMSSTVGKILRRLGIHKLPQVRTSQGQRRFWVLRNWALRWAEVDRLKDGKKRTGMIANHFEDTWAFGKLSPTDNVVSLADHRRAKLTQPRKKKN